MSDGLTIEKLKAVYDQLQPPVLYYGTSDGLTPGRALWHDKSATGPAFIVFHPDDEAHIRSQLEPSCRLVHLSEWEPKPDELDGIFIVAMEQIDQGIERDIDTLFNRWSFR